MRANVWESWRERVDDRLGDPIWWNDVLQLAKTVLAAVAAWVIAASVLDLPQPFLAPWAALLVVHATVYRTFSKGTQQVAATVVAVLLATVVGEALGLSTGADHACCWSWPSCSAPCRGWAPRPPRSRPPAWWCSPPASRTTSCSSRGCSTPRSAWRSACSSTCSCGRRCAGTRRPRPWTASTTASASCSSTWPAASGTAARTRTSTAWIDRTRDLDGDVDQAWALVRQAEESARMNPRRSARLMKNPREWHGLLRRMEQADRRDPQPGPHARQPAGSPGDVGRGLRRPVDRDAGRHGTGRQRGRPRRAARRAPPARGAHRGAADHRALARVAGLRRADHQPAQHHRRHGRVAEANPIGHARVPIRVPVRRAGTASSP